MREKDASRTDGVCSRGVRRVSVDLRLAVRVRVDVCSESAVCAQWKELCEQRAPSVDEVRQTDSLRVQQRVVLFNAECRMQNADTCDIACVLIYFSIGVRVCTNRLIIEFKVINSD